MDLIAFYKGQQNKQQRKMSRLRQRQCRINSSFKSSCHSNRSTLKKLIIQHNVSLTAAPAQSLKPLEKNHFLNRQKLFNRNITYFRNSFNTNDSSQLPFMSSLRMETPNQSSNKRLSLTISQPFQVSQKSTFNQKCKKRVSDMGKMSKVSTVYYRWHNKSGKNIKNSVDFQCSLRDYNEKNPQEEKFKNYIKPIQYLDVQAEFYDSSQLICPRQRKLFRIKQ